MRDYVVLYRDETLLAADAPYAFACQADDSDHAEEQCMNTEPNATVVWVCETDSIDMAYSDYWSL